LRFGRALVMRAVEGGSVAEIAAELKVCPAKVRKWWHRFGEAGAEGLLDEPRPGQPRKLSNTYMRLFRQEKPQITFVNRSP